MDFWGQVKKDDTSVGVWAEGKATQEADSSAVSGKPIKYKTHNLL